MSRSHLVKILILLAAIFPGTHRSIAQDSTFIGNWYIIYNDISPLSTGEEFEIRITKRAHNYVIANTNGNYATYFPDTGTYAKTSNDKLEKGPTELHFTKDRMFFEDNGRVEFINKRKIPVIEYCIKQASLILDKVDSIKNRTRSRDSLKKCLYYLNKALAYGYCRDCYFDKCLADYKLGAIDSAVNDMQSIEDTYPGYPKTPELRTMLANYYLNHAWEHYGKKGKYPEAIAEYKKALAFDPENADLWYNLGGAYYTSKQYPEAVKAFKESLRIDPQARAQEGLNAAQSMMESK